MTAPAGVKTFISAVRSGDAASVRNMVTANRALLAASDPDCFGATPLIHAVNNRNLEMADLLLDLGADVDQRSDWWAGSFGVLDSASDELASHLLKRGATLTPHAAARLGMINELRALLDADPSCVHARGGDGQTPLHFARTAEIADLLLARGADIDALDIDHASTPAQWLATSRPEVAVHLVSRGAKADPFIAVRAGDTSLLLRTLIESGPDGIKMRITRDRFPAAAPAAGHIYLFTIGEGCTLMHAAAQANQPEIIRWLAQQHGADMNARGGYDDGTPLHVAAWCDAPEAAEALIDVGADINAKSGHMHHNEPLGWAIVGGSVNTARVLLRRGATLQAHHIEDAQRGAQGAFRQFQAERPLEAWRQIADTIAKQT